MAHELEILGDGTAAMAYVGQVPWHGLGVKVEDDLTPFEMLQAAKLDWKVEKAPTFAETVSGKRVATGNYAIIRQDNHRILSPNVSASWEPVDNEKCFEIFVDFVKEAKAKMHTAGSLRGGQIIWGLAKIEDKITLFGGDEIEGYLLLSASHLYGKVSNFDVTPIRVVCNNTLTMALESKSRFAVSVNHRSTFDPEVVKLMMGIAHSQLVTYYDKCDLLGKTSFNSRQLKEYFSEIFPLPKTSKSSSETTLSDNVMKCMNAVHSQPGSEYAEGTWWQAYNAVTYVTDHVLGRTADTRMYNSWFGTTRSKKLEAFALAQKFALA